MNTQFNIEITLTEKEASEALASFIAAKLGPEFSVKPDSVRFEVAMVFEDRPGGGSSPKFKKVTAKAVKL